MRLQINATINYSLPEPVDLLLAMEIAQTADQILVEDRLLIDAAGPLRPIAGEDGLGRRTLMRAEGAFKAAYQATVDVVRNIPDLSAMTIASPAALPARAIPYVWPSRYCESDKFEEFVKREFGDLHGGRKVQAMADWIHQNMEYRIGSSDGGTTAIDTFVKRQGVCRDFAHLLASFARAADIPARLVSAYALDLVPPDFHAVVEVWLDDDWQLIDATRLAPLDGLVRIAVGRDATDIAFLTIFGTAELQSQTVEVSRIDSVDNSPGAQSQE